MSRIFIFSFIVTVLFAHAHAEDAVGLKCEPNAEPKPCGDLCPQTCERPEKIFCHPVDKERCKYKCRCIDGYVRHHGKCIKVEQCPKKCPHNETLNICGHVCEPTCQNPKPKHCPGIACSESTEDCRCNPGHVRDLVTNACVLPKDCVKCGKNEEVGSCGRICEMTCEDQNPGKCAAITCTGFGCKCKEGFFRNEKTDKCGTLRQCPIKKCAYGEILAPCGRTCEGTCKEPFLPKICEHIKCSKQDCRCDLDSGFVRGKDGKCVRAKSCRHEKTD